ncbi:MAG TPA: FAD-binding oxidoreductase [Chloroflexota bacterium]|nr:FAD-binding oxidoreductase [Chloroflexota bacterium]
MDVRLREIVGAHVWEAGTEDAIDGVQPALVIEPGSVEEAAAVLRLANENNLAVAPRGGGSKLGWGNPPERLDWILSTVRMNRVLEHAAGDLVVRVQAGACLRDVQQELAGAGQWLALDPPEAEGTIGGIIAANDFGSHRLRFGTVRDLLIGITYVLPDGTVAKAGGKVVKNVAGYDLNKLFTGSLGTLGLIAEAIFRLHPVPASSRAVVAPQSGAGMGAGELGGAVQSILDSSLVPSALDFEWREGGRLFVLFEGVETGVTAQAEAARQLLDRRGGAAILEDVQVRPLWQGMGRPQLDRNGTRLKITTPIAELPALITCVENLAAGHPLVRTMWGHAGSGIAYLDLGADEQPVIALLAELREKIAALGGSVVAHAAPAGVKRALDVWGEVGTALPLMLAVKRQFDPMRVMNPGRFVGGI